MVMFLSLLFPQGYFHSFLRALPGELDDLGPGPGSGLGLESGLRVEGILMTFHWFRSLLPRMSIFAAQHQFG